MPSPGWYTDPQDPSGLRWFDGDDWTEHQAPATQDSSVDSSAASYGEAANLPSTGSEPYPAGYGSAPHYGAGSADTTQYIPVTPQAAPAATAATAATAAQAATPTTATRSTSRNARRASKQLPIIIAVVVVLVAGLLTGAWLLFHHGGGSTFTYQGKSISRPADALTQAETDLDSLLASRHGAQDSDTRCYYALPASPSSGAKKTDVDSALRCGPVLFVDGDASKQYLSFAVNSSVIGAKATLKPSATPESDAPAALPAGFSFKRPDGKTPPSGAGGLTAPSPQPADVNVLTTAVLTAPAGAQHTTGVMGSLGGGVAIDELGKIARYGTGDAARSAPVNQQLLAFKLTGAAGNSGTVTDLSSSTTLSVDGAAGRVLPTLKTGEYIVAAVPATAKTVDLVLTDTGIVQTFSLLDGKPGATNIAVLARVHRTDVITQTLTVTLNYSTKVVFADNVTAQSQTAAIALTGATLTYKDETNNATASAPANALLIPDVVYTGSHDGGPFGIDTTLLSFTPTGGAAIPAKNVSTDPNKIRNVFEVPAGVTTGTLTVGGTATETFSSGGGSYTLAVATPMSFPIAFAAG